MDVSSKLVAIGFSLMILLQAYVVRRIVGTWVFPACLFGLFWFGYTFIPLTVLYWVPIEPLAVGFILLCTVAFSLGSVPFRWVSAFGQNRDKKETATLVYSSSFLRFAFYLSASTSLFFIALNLFAQGFSATDLLLNLFATAKTYSDLHYAGDLKGTEFDQWSLVFAYLGAIFGGFLFSCTLNNAQRRRILTLAFLPSLAVALTESSKGLLFLCIAFFYAGILVHRIAAGRPQLLEKKSFGSVILSGVVVVLVVALALLARGLSKIKDTSELISKFAQYYASYSCSHLYAFSDWFAYLTGRHSQFHYSPEPTSYGFYTFLALYAKLGVQRVVPSTVFDEYYSYGDLLSGNIYTMFRGLIIDFGLIGSLIFMFAMGLLLHLAFNFMLRRKRPVVPVAVFVFMVAYSYMSFIVSAFMWMNMYVTFFLLCVFLSINKFVTQGSIKWSSS